MATARGEIDTAQVDARTLERSIELRVAVVHEGQIRGSTIVTVPQKGGVVAFSVDFPIVIDPGAFLPCPIRVLVGPNLADREFLRLPSASTIYVFSRSQPGAARGRRRRTTAESTRVGTQRTGLEVRVASQEETEQARTEFTNATIDVGRIEIAAHLYRCWLVCCRTFTIRGRVVCRNWKWNSGLRRFVWCDDPVPGATVEIYDVDRFLWWYAKDLVTSATTAIDGSFEAKFTWCCWWWYPWEWPAWSIDPRVWERIREIAIARNMLLPPNPPDPDPTYLQRLVATLSEPERQQSAALEQRALARGRQSSTAPRAVSAETLRGILGPAPDLAALRVWPWWDADDCNPDVVFRVRQNCDGVDVVIHDESIVDTRWNIGTDTDVILLANDLACCLPWCGEPQCPDCLKFTYVGCEIPADRIAGAGAAGPPDLRGYIDATTMKDEPLYGPLLLQGLIGTEIDYYRVQYAKDAGGWMDLPTPAFAGYSTRYLQNLGLWSPFITFAPVPKSYGAGTVSVIPTQRHYDEANAVPPTPGLGYVGWQDPEYLFTFDPTGLSSLGDGLYELRLVGYEADAADQLVAGSEGVIRTCGLLTAETIFLRIDGQARPHHPAADHPCDDAVHFCTDEPEAYIRSLIKNEGLPSQETVSVCDIVTLDPSDTLTVHFTVTVPANLDDGHLGGYVMRADFGASDRFIIGTASLGAPCPVDPAKPLPRLPRGVFVQDGADPSVQVGPTYAQALAAGAPRPHWYGGNYKVTLQGCDFPECCAYEIYLHAWKRTTNWCNVPEWTHWNQWFDTFTVLRRDLCPDVCGDHPGG